MAETPRNPIPQETRKILNDKDLGTAAGGFVKKELWISTPTKPEGSALPTEQIDQSLGGKPAGT